MKSKRKVITWWPSQAQFAEAANIIGCSRAYLVSAFRRSFLLRRERTPAKRKAGRK